MDFNYLTGKIIRHFKGDLYLILGVAQHTETGEKMVIYKALYGKCETYARPLPMFNEVVAEGKVNPTGQKYRFEEFIVDTKNKR